MPQKQRGAANLQRSALMGPVIFALIAVALLYKQKIQKALGIEEDNSVGQAKS